MSCSISVVWVVFIPRMGHSSIWFLISRHRSQTVGVGARGRWDRQALVGRLDDRKGVGLDESCTI